ncbi:MAG: HAMP domain-containing protein [Verrucomicrobiaceae bacterium]|nr:HAMP domain-containing protein [Verrucomicrobiaceae bacterium]
MRFNLRAKLIIIMSVVVAAATLATAWVSQGYVRTFYEQRYEEEFKSEIRFFSEKQLQRHEKLRVFCQKLAAHEEIRDAVIKGDSRAVRLVQDQLRKAYEGEMRSTDLLTGPRTINLKEKYVMPPAVVEIIDSDGKVLEPGSLSRFFPGLRNRVQGKKTQGIKDELKRMAERSGSEQEVNYRLPPDPNDPAGKPRVWEYIITPVLTEKDREPAGAIFVGLPMPDLGEQLLHEFTAFTADGSKREREAEAASSGLWLGNEDGKPTLLTRTIPENIRDDVMAAVSQRIANGHDASRFAGVDIRVDDKSGGGHYHVLHRVLNPDSPFEPAAQVCVFSLAPLEAQEAQLRNSILWIGFLSLLGAVVLIWFLTRGMVRPIHELVAGTEEIRQGRFDVKVAVSSRDEIGTLAESFNEMAEGLRLNQKYQRLLSQVADRMVAEQLMNNEAALGGELREVSVLFCDIRGFTSLTAGMPPGEVISLLNEHMSALTELIHEHCGVVDKFVGDMIMALFGAPSAYGDDAQRAAECAMRMVECRERLNANGKWNFHVGIGIATGTVVAGCMGSEERLDYTVLGDRVNLASRLCSIAGEAEVLIDQTTLEKLGERAATTPLTELHLKGFPESVNAFSLEAVRTEVLQLEFNPGKAVEADIVAERTSP